MAANRIRKRGDLPPELSARNYYDPENTVLNADNRRQTQWVMLCQRAQNGEFCALSHVEQAAGWVGMQPP